MNQTTISKLKELGELYKDGILSKEEFDTEKKKILSQEDKDESYSQMSTNQNIHANNYTPYPQSQSVYNHHHDSQYQYHPRPEYYGGKSKSTAIILAFLLGGTGIADFYVGNTGKGVLLLILFFIFFIITIFTLGFGFILLFILWLVDFIPFVSMSDEEFNRKYNHIR